jgi:hypothetical protein
VDKSCKSLNMLHYGSGCSGVRYTQMPGFHTKMPALQQFAL